MKKRTNLCVMGIAVMTMAILFAMTAMPVSAGPPGMPVGVCGFVYLADGTPAPYGTSVSVEDIGSGFYKEGTTGFGPFPNVYFVMISGSDGDTVIIKAWDETHYGETTVTLNGVMRGVDVILDKPLAK